VLQLDICKFTTMSRDLNPLLLARMIHEIFSSFDKSVVTLQLYKMDTIGDAYIVAGWLPDGDDWQTRDETKTTCLLVLDLARKMISTLKRYNESRRHQLNCRIGIGIGDVACGLLGRSQARFHLLGDAANLAEQLE
ncbi:hypothetical protein GUITHDRAFT_60850, partial [Guillardia theta CCMP2712]